ncbi:MAG TPA: CRISPR-associated helicase Cas3', partial [Kiritimatiellia bacterium]|nr:CRISPR-associated helicase Cas3' [Kiritimatiellia bacterium]
QPLSQHLQNVAKRAADNAAHFQSADWAYLAGLLHDLGKASDAFQAYLLRSNGLDDSEYDSAGQPSTHSGAGAKWALEKYGPLTGRILAYIITGHHAGIPDWVGGAAPGGALINRLEDAAQELQAVRLWAEQFHLPPESPKPPFKMAEREIHLWVRMLYSCMVDADFLDTEHFMNPASFKERRTFPKLQDLIPGFFRGLDAMQAQAVKSEVNSIRAEVRDACENAASHPPGFFSLSVPTGGGKTLSGTAFALRHAACHGQRRIIYVIPYTSIIEQTADVLRHHLGVENVVEHHSNLDPETQAKAARLASENWDAPIIVTTSVQFFESLLGARSSRCRKLHNIANSVVILDEVQLLPPELLEPCTDLLRQLVERYGVTIVLSTATQPSLPNIENVQEIIEASARLPERLRRVVYELPNVLENRSNSWPEVAKELEAYAQVLCVVNTRRDCLELFRCLPPGTVHLSASMCGAHRSQVIESIKAKLRSGAPIRVVSTQLVEAGVDIDFPVVYRALAGLDSIVQSAGRCNREGRQAAGGKVVVFIPPRSAPKGILRKAEDAARVMLASPISLEGSEIYPRYFREFYSRVEGRFPYQTLLVQNARSLEFQFREAAAQFHIIDQAHHSVFVRHGEGDALIETLRRQIRDDMPYGWLLRKLQRFSITLPQGQLNTLLHNGQIEELTTGLFVWNGRYDEITGADIFNEDGILSAKDTVL